MQDAAVRIQALDLLSEQGQDDPRVKELLRRIARGDKDKDVRQSAKSLLEDLDQITYVRCLRYVFSRQSCRPGR